MNYTRLLKNVTPYMRGEDVRAMQSKLYQLGYAAETPDGVFGNNTEAAVRDFQAAHNLSVDGEVGPNTWKMLFPVDENQHQQRFKQLLQEIQQEHAFRDSVSWSLTPQGISIDGHDPQYTGGQPQTVSRIWRELRNPLVHWSTTLGVPVELIIATICTESGGNLNIQAREEPGYVSDEETPNKVSPGIMQTLISTARNTLGAGSEVDRAWLEQPENSIQAGTSYIASQWNITRFDPPKVACAYNAGNLYYNDSPNNRWKMRQYPIGTDAHANRFVLWFNDCFRVLNEDDDLPGICYCAALQPELVV